MTGDGRRNFEPQSKDEVAPKCNSSDIETYVLTETEIMNISCNAYADPEDLIFLWSLENSQGIISLQNWSSWDMLSYSVTDYGYGALSCWGQNSIGVQEYPCQFKLLAASIPEAPHSCVLSNLSSHFFSIECEPGYNGSLYQEFHLEVYCSKKENLKHNLTEVTTPSFKVDGLSPGKTYVLLIYSSNAKGNSNSVALVATTLLSKEQRTRNHGKFSNSRGRDWYGSSAFKVKENLRGGNVYFPSPNYLQNNVAEEMGSLARETHKRAEIWFQQDRAKVHTSRRSLGILRELFPGYLLSLQEDIA
ncbi:nephrin [Trichonephila clavipes]|nr:nephrin [Trichonephila clavipes]